MTISFIWGTGNMGKKPGPKAAVKERDKAKVRAITASDSEWAQVVKIARERGLSASHLIRTLIRELCEQTKGA